MSAPVPVDDVGGVGGDEQAAAGEVGQRLRVGGPVDERSEFGSPDRSDLGCSDAVALQVVQRLRGGVARWSRGVVCGLRCPFSAVSISIVMP